MRLDFIAKCSLIVIAVSLAWLVFGPLALPPAVQAQSGQPHPFYVEPGVSMLRAPDGSRQVFGKVMVDMRTGKIWGFPTLQQEAVYPIDTTTSTPPVSHPFLLGKFAFGDTDK